jgi:FAD/FMN-containing dehydrogenase/Fe-S oxidoreductase
MNPALLSELTALLGDRISTGELIRGIHATDASHYQIQPQAVVWPKDEAEISGILRRAAKAKVPTTVRGAATSLSGQTHGPGIILDVSRHLNQILELNPEEGWARVQPGVIRDQLNAAAAEHGLQFAPDPATSSRATVGGMIGNNSSGTRSVLYGKTSDHLLSCRIALSDGRTVEFAPALEAEWDATETADLFRQLKHIIDANRERIIERFPQIMRRVSGYALDAFLEDPAQTPWNLARLICGAEGTLGVLTEAKLRLVPLPKFTAVVAVHFDDLLASLRAIEPMLRFGPSAIELLDHTVLREAQTNASTREIADFILGEPQAMQLVEFFGDTETETAQKAADMVAELSANGMGYAWPVFTDPASQTRAWDVRRLGLGLITNKKGATKGQAFMEDAAIPLPHLPEYIEKMMAKCKEEEVNLVLYAHSSVGVLHARPELDLHLPEDIAKMRRIAEYGFSLCVQYGGIWAGEHGDGLVRGEFIRKFFGPELYEAFRQVKALFDPHNLMNPNKIIDPPPMTEHMRYQVPGYTEKAKAAEAKALFHYRSQGGFTLAVEQCNGVGACRKLGSGVMCPSFMATRDEKDSTRARANALRLAITGQLKQGDTDEAMASDELQEIMGLCLSCKACKKECPNAVDVSKMKAEVLQRRYDIKGTPRGARIVGGLPAIAHRMCGPHAPLMNWGQNLTPVRKLLERVAGIDARRPLPRFATLSLRARLGDTRSIGTPDRGEVALYIDSYTNAYDPHIGEAAIELLSTCGYRVHPVFAGDSQRARISKGLLREAKQHGEKVMRNLDEWASKSIPILCLEPSCASALKDDLPDLLDDAALGARVSDSIFLVDEFLHRKNIPVRAKYPKMKIHGHCHQKAVFGIAGLKALLPEADFIDAGCCGMAGSFGYEHRDLSLKIGEDRLFPALRANDKDTVVVASGFSCRHQVQDALGITPLHVVEVLQANPSQE